MGFIPEDILSRGKSTFSIIEKQNFLSSGTVIGESWGLQTDLVDDAYHFTNNVESGGTYKGGFKTKSFKMMSGTSTLVYKADFTLEGLIYGETLFDVTFTDGTNSINFYVENQTYNSSTQYLGTVNGTAVSGTVATYYNIAGDYNSQRSTTGVYVRANETFRVDKERGEIVILNNDQTIGRAKIAGLESFGESWFEFTFYNTTQDSVSMYVKQIGLKLDC